MMNTTARILVVEDEPHLRDVTVRVLRSAGYEVVEAATGSEGLRLANELQPDIILLDVVLPDIDGNEVCRRLKVDPVTATSFVLILNSLKTSSNEQATGLASGADGSIARPISNLELLARIEVFLRLRRAEIQRDAFLRELQEAHDTLEIQVAERTAELADANEKLLVRSRELEALNTLSREVSGSLSLETVIHAALKQFEEAVVPELVMLFLQENDRLLLKGVRPQHSPYAHVETPAHRVGECLFGLAAQQGKPLYSLDIHSDPRYIWDECKRAGLRSVAAIPLKSNGDTLGVLALGSAEERDFSTQAAFLETLAHEVALGIKNACLYEQSRQDALQLKENLDVLRQTRKEWEEIFQAIGHPTLILSPDFRIIAANRTALEAIGKTEAELKGQTCFETFHMSNSPPDACPMQKLLNSGHFETAEMEVQALDRIFFVSCTPIQDENGALQKIIHIATDITERKQADEALKESLARWESLVENTRDFIAIIDRDGIIQYINHVPPGFRYNDLIGRSDYDYIDPEYHEMVKRAIQQVFDTRQAVSYEVQAINPCGTLTWYETRLSPLILDDEVVSVTRLSFDITARKQAADILQESEERFRTIIENTEAGYFLIDREGKFQDVNEAWLRMHGYTLPDEVIGRHFALTQVEGDLEQAQKNVEALLKGGAISSGEFTRRCKDGSVGYHSFSMSPVVKGGRIVGLEGFLIDISERKRAEEQLKAYSENLERLVTERTRELQETQEKLIRQERLAAIGQLAGGVGHELRTPLATISNAVYYLKMVLPDANADVTEYLEMIADETRNAEKIISDLLDFARIKTLNKALTGALTVVELVLNHLTIPEKIQLVCDVPEELPEILVDRRHLEQVLLNLCKNACDAMPDGGTLTISARQAVVGRKQAAESRRQKAGGNRQRIVIQMKIPHCLLLTVYCLL